MIDSLPVSSPDTFIFQCQSVGVSYHVQTRRQCFVHHAYAICVWTSTEHKDTSNKIQSIIQKSLAKEWDDSDSLTRMDQFEAENQQGARSKQSISSNQHDRQFSAQNKADQ